VARTSTAEESDSDCNPTSKAQTDRKTVEQREEVVVVVMMMMMMMMMTRG